MNIFESQAGYDFVSYHFPRLVTAVEKLAEAMAAKPSFPDIPVQLRESVLRDLYNGYFCPGDEAGYTQTKQYERLTAMMCKLEAELKSQIGVEFWRTVEQYCNDFAERDGEEMKISFEAGFRAATQLLIAGLTFTKEEPADEV